jgi:hypothetical protein
MLKSFTEAHPECRNLFHDPVPNFVYVICMDQEWHISIEPVSMQYEAQLVTSA